MEVDSGIERAQTALAKILGSGRAELGTCLECGRTLGDEPSVWLHGDGFHTSCARYRPTREASS